MVIEVDPSLKRDLHSVLAADGLTLKEWFLKRVEAYFSERRQPVLPGIFSSPEPRVQPTLLAAEKTGEYHTDDTKT